MAGQHSVVRLTPTGALDASFGTGGRLSVPGIVIQSVALAPDGAIVVAGTQVVPDGSGKPGGSWSVARFLPSGISDSGFGQRGTVALDANVGLRVDVGVGPDGHVIVAGLGIQDNRSSAFAPITSLRADGSLDSDFGQAGLATLPRLEAEAMAVQPDGRIVVGGLRWPAVAGNGLPQAIVTRLDKRGRPDASFGHDGVAMLRDTPSSTLVDPIAGLTLQPDGAIVAVGSWVATCCYSVSYAFLGTLTRDGQVAQLESIGSGRGDPEEGCFAEKAEAVSVQADARILVGGLVCGSTSWIARFTKDLRLDVGSPLRLHRTQARGTASLRAPGPNSLTQLTATVKASSPAHVLVTVRPAKSVKGIPGALIATGGRLPLQPGSAAGQVTLKRPAKKIEAVTDQSGRISLRLLVAPRLFSRGDRGIATVHARDAQGRMAEVAIEFVRR